MRLFRDLSIRIRLMTVLLFWIVIIISFGIIAIVQMQNIATVTQKIYDYPLKISNAAREVHVDVIKIHREMKDLILSPTEAEVAKHQDIINALEQRVLSNMNIIKKQSSSNDGVILYREITNLLEGWNEGRNIVINLTSKGEVKEAASISQNKHSLYVKQIEEKLGQIDKSEGILADQLIADAHEIESSQKFILIISFSILSFIGAIITMIIGKSILKPIEELKNVMNISVNSSDILESDIKGKNEFADMSEHYNILIRKLRNQFWIKDAQNDLNKELSGDNSLIEITEKAIQFLGRFLQAGNGVFYLYDDNKGCLYLNASYAFTERDLLCNKCAIGEGIIGQVALEKSPILLKNIRRQDALISTGTINGTPLNVYAFPLIYENKLYGVIELSSFESFTELKQEFLRQASYIITINLYSVIQRDKIKNLLKESEGAKLEAQVVADELQNANQVLEEQQRLLQQQTEELQKSNAELEEQQQLLQQQSEELQQTNTQLEEQQHQLETQSRILNIKNEELQNSREELIDRSKQLELTNKYKSEFLANMSHELRTPLNSIILLSKLLMNSKNSNLKKDCMEKINIIYNSGNELLRLINDVLDLSKIESGMMNLEIISFHSEIILKELKELFGEMVKEKNLKLIIKDYVNTDLYGDKDKISQILRNLTANALKFTECGSIIIKLELAENSKKDVIFSVVDTGIGIPEDKIKMIFEEFHQGDGSISRKYGGTGLGLSISKKLAKLMKGHIKVESEVEIGSCFKLFLPDIIQVSKDVGKANSLVACTNENVERIKTLKYERKHEKVILIVEDDKNFAEHIKEINEGMGFDTLIVSSGREALKVLEECSVDGILLDMALKDISGIEVLKELKSSPELKRIPIHIISAYYKDNSEQKISNVGFNQKAVKDDEIIKLIYKMISFSEKKPKQLLIIEDDIIQQEAMAELLQNADVEIHCADTEIEAKKEILKGTYDTVILDLELQEGNGLNICKFISEKKIQTPIIVHTGKDLTIEQEKELNKYTDSIILKTANSDKRLMDEVALFLHQLKNSDKKENYLLCKTNKNYSLNLKGKKILVVDDDTRNIFVLASALEDFEAEVFEAENGKDALEKLKEIDVDLILMDVMMPVMDGYKTIKSIRRNEKLKEIPIIALTAKGLKEDRSKCIEAGADDYISKPVDYDIFIRLVKAWITKKN